VPIAPEVDLRSASTVLYGVFDYALKKKEIPENPLLLVFDFGSPGAAVAGSLEGARRPTDCGPDERTPRTEHGSARADPADS
jgi:hypothetical protein